MEKKAEREARRQRARREQAPKEERNRRRAIGGGRPNELGITQGQNAEQGNTMNPRNAVQPTRRTAYVPH